MKYFSKYIFGSFSISLKCIKRAGTCKISQFPPKIILQNWLFYGFVIIFAQKFVPL